MSRATISRLMLVCWRGLLRCYTLCCVIYKYNLLGVISCLLAAFTQVSKLRVLKADRSVPH
jgi:hypothetical protein